MSQGCWQCCGPLLRAPTRLCHDTVCCILTQHHIWTVAHSSLLFCTFFFLFSSYCKTTKKNMFFFFKSSCRTLENYYFFFFSCFTYCKTSEKNSSTHYFFLLSLPIASTNLLLPRCSGLDNCNLYNSKILRVKI